MSTVRGPLTAAVAPACRGEPYGVCSPPRSRWGRSTAAAHGGVRARRHPRRFSNTPVSALPAICASAMVAPKLPVPVQERVSDGPVCDSKCPPPHTHTPNPPHRHLPTNKPFHRRLPEQATAVREEGALRHHCTIAHLGRAGRASAQPSSDLPEEWSGPGRLGRAPAAFRAQQGHAGCGHTRRGRGPGGTTDRHARHGLLHGYPRGSDSPWRKRTRR